MLNILTEYPWAITEKALKEIITAVQKFDIKSANGSPYSTSASERVQIIGNIAVISVKGSIFRYSNIFTDYYNLTTVDNLSEDVAFAENHRDVDKVVFYVDSGGGQANGISEFTQKVSQMLKPTTSYISGSGASAAYWIASATDNIVISKTAIAGSIGAMLEIYDDSEMLEKFGIKKTVYKSKVSPNKNSDTELQTIVDRLGEEFVTDVAKNRNVSFEYVLENYGQGGLFVGEDAVNAGLADSVGVFEDVLSSLKTEQTNINSSVSTKQKQIDLLNMEVSK